VGRAVAEAVAAEVERQLAVLPRRDIARQAVDNQGIAFVVNDVSQAIDLVNRLAPEHAGLALANAATWADQVTAAGAVFVGEHACESVGDYFAGPSHVLPTGGSARYASPLGVADFVKRTSLIEYGPEALARQADKIEALAEVEGLAAHGRAVSIRRQEQ
jgi:histidinol dehydrogenase